MIKKNDIVRIISGDFKGKQGKIVKILTKKNKIQIENIGFCKKHIKPRVNKNHPEGGIIEQLKFIDISNVIVVTFKTISSD